MAELKNAQWLKINDMVTDIYNINGLTEMRKAFLEKIRLLIPFQKAFFDLCSEKSGKRSFFDPVAADIPEESLKEYYATFEEVDYTAWVLTQNVALSYRDTDILPPALRENSVFFCKWLMPMGIFYEGGCNIAYNGIVYGSVTLMRAKSAGDFTDAELYMLNILNQHMCRRFSNEFPNGIDRQAVGTKYPGLVSRYGLTMREYEILCLIKGGLSNREISEKLFISENTTKKHIWHIFKKLNISSRAQVLKFFR